MKKIQLCQVADPSAAIIDVSRCRPGDLLEISFRTHMLVSFQFNKHTVNGLPPIERRKLEQHYLVGDIQGVVIQTNKQSHKIYACWSIFDWSPAHYLVPLGESYCCTQVSHKIYRE